MKWVRWATLLLGLVSPVLCMAGAPSEANRFEQIKERVNKAPFSSKKEVDNYMAEGVRKKNDSIIAQANYLYGIIYYFDSKFYLSGKHYTKALQSGYARKNIDFAGRCWNNMGISYSELTLYKKALQAYHHSYTNSEQLGDSLGMIQSQINMAELNQKLGKYQLSSQLLTKVLDYSKRHNEVWLMVLAHQNFGALFLDMNRYERSLANTQKALELNKQLNDEYAESGLLYNIGNCYMKLGRYDEARRYLLEALKKAKKYQIHGLVATIYVAFGQDELRRGNNTACERYLLDALQLARRHKTRDQIEAIYTDLLHFYAKTGNITAYEQTTDEFRKQKVKRQEQESVARIEELQAMYEFQSYTSRIEQQETELSFRHSQLVWSIVFSGIILVVLSVVSYFYLRMRRYMRTLFENRVQQVEPPHLPDHNPGIGSEQTDHLADLYRRIVQLMEENKLYKRSGLSVGDLSDELGSNEKYVSQAINQFARKNFNAFLNTYRINEICKSMIENGKKKSLKEIVAESPFSNYTSFYRQFKEITGLTPVDFITMSERKLSTDRLKHYENNNLDYK